MSDRTMSPTILRTRKIVGRAGHIDAFRHAIVESGVQSQTIYLHGPAGIGKTRLLEEVKQIRQEVVHRAGYPFVWSGIIDLFHHSDVASIQQLIVKNLDRDGRQFDTYREKRVQFEQARSGGLTGSQLEDLRQQLVAAFRHDFELFTDIPRQRVVLTFDTCELIQFERDPAQERFEIDNPDTSIKRWILNEVSQYKNTVVVLAGRPDKHFEAELNDAFATLHVREIMPLTKTETYAYLSALKQRSMELADLLDEALQERIYDATMGRPIYISLITDLLQVDHSIEINDVFPVDADNSISTEAWALVGRKICRYLAHYLPEPGAAIVNLLAYAHRGLTPELLLYLTGSEAWVTINPNLPPYEAAQKAIRDMQRYTFIKTPANQPHTIFFHDEIYDLFDQFYLDEEAETTTFPRIRNYYREEYTKLRTRLEKLERGYHTKRDQILTDLQNVTVKLLHYELQVDVKSGYHEGYSRWIREAISAHQAEYDIRLRNEVLRFFGRYGGDNPAVSNVRTRHIKDQIDQTSFVRDETVRWIRRAIARGDYTLSRGISERVLAYQGDELYPHWEQIDDPLYKADFLTAYAETLSYLGRLDEGLCELDKALQLVGTVAEDYPDLAWRKARTLGRVHNNFGLR